MEASFDTLGAAQRLEACGLERSQAEEIARVVWEGQGTLVTKGDMNAGLDSLESRLRVKIEEQKWGVVKWVLGTSLGTAGLLLAGLRLLLPSGGRLGATLIIGSPPDQLTFIH